MGLEKKDVEPTTFNMEIGAKTKAKMYVASHNQKMKNEKDQKTNLGKLINDAVKHYLSDVKFEGIDE